MTHSLPPELAEAGNREAAIEAVYQASLLIASALALQTDHHAFAESVRDLFAANLDSLADGNQLLTAADIDDEGES